MQRVSISRILTAASRRLALRGPPPDPFVSSTCAVLVAVPTRGTPAGTRAARPLLDAFRLHAAVAVGQPARLIAVDARERRLWCLDTGEPLAIASLWHPRVTLLMNAAFLLADPPPAAALFAQAARRSFSWCAARGTADAYACAFGPYSLAPHRLWDALCLLTACVDDEARSEWEALDGEPLVTPDATSDEHSPALRGITGRIGLRSFDAPVFLNTAIRELLDTRHDEARGTDEASGLAAWLLWHRERSRVPWIFNALLNEIEYRLGERAPRSVPPEIHLSIAGRCNIECRFCAYEHAIARNDLVTSDQVSRLDFLSQAQTFRLHSGLGEPTVNPHLPDIIERTARRFPHLTLNFFTNAVALGKPRLIEAMVGRVRWINASLNAASRETWQAVCDEDLFDRVTAGLRALHEAKRARRALHPLVFGSMVLTAANLDDLPRMPALCRALGIDRFTAFPYFGLGYHGHRKYGPEQTLEACRARYDRLYGPTVDAARAEGISIELPLPAAEKRVAFGCESRPLHDFARIEANQWRLGRFVSHLTYDRPPGAHCGFLWRSAGIGSTNGAGHSAAETHYLYPCIGPLSSVDLSRHTGFRFPQTKGFLDLWHNPVFTLLRDAQHQTGVSEVCDACRSCDTRDPAHFPALDALVAAFAHTHAALPETAAGDTHAHASSGISM